MDAVAVDEDPQTTKVEIAAALILLVKCVRCGSPMKRIAKKVRRKVVRITYVCEQCGR